MVGSFWKHALIRQMHFVSSNEQDASGLLELKKELASTAPDIQRLCFKLQDSLLSDIRKSILDPTFNLLSLLLQQMQVAEILSMPSPSSVFQLFFLINIRSQ